MKKCPFCGEEIQNEAKKCKWCGEWLEKDEQNLAIESGYKNKVINKDVKGPINRGSVIIALAISIFNILLNHDIGGDISSFEVGKIIGETLVVFVLSYIIMMLIFMGINHFFFKKD